VTIGLVSDRPDLFLHRVILPTDASLLRIRRFSKLEVVTYRALVSTTLLGLSLIPTARAAERVVQRSFSVQPGAELVVDTYRGSIEVEESDESEVRVRATLVSDLRDEREANRAFDALQLEMKPEGNRVAVSAKNPRQTQVRFVWNEKEQLELAYLITVPRQCSVNLATANGAILVGSLAGKIVARTDAGTITLRRIDGSIQATTKTGDIVISRCSGDVALSALRGNLRVGPVGGRAELKTATGDIEVQAIRGSLRATAGDGDVTAGFAAGLNADSLIETAAGNIGVKLDPAANCNLTASSVWGKVECTVPFAVLKSGGSGKGKFSAEINRGGPLVTLHASGGHVKIEPLDQAAE
jgi:DUF4097 and DUF4098 domain-containing protein YvlB